MVFPSSGSPSFPPPTPYVLKRSTSLGFPLGQPEGLVTSSHSRKPHTRGTRSDPDRAGACECHTSKLVAAVGMHFPQPREQTFSPLYHIDFPMCPFRMLARNLSLSSPLLEVLTWNEWIRKSCMGTCEEYAPSSGFQIRGCILAIATVCYCYCTDPTSLFHGTLCALPSK